MATMLGSLLISLGLDSGQFRSGMSAAEKEVVKFQRSMNKTAQALQDLGARMTLGITAPLVAFGGFAVKAASDAEELQSAFDQTFGALSKQMTEWAETTGDAMGRSTQEIQQAANTFGIFFNQAAPTKQAAAELSKEFSVLAQDLSSFFNVDPTEAMQKLRSGLSGESEPLRDFGVFLNEAAVKAKAFEIGIAAAGSELTEQQKIMARAALIMDATATAQGDVARTADGTANRVRAAKAAFEELQVAIGEKLIPAVRPLVEGLTNMLSAFTALPDGAQTSIIAFAGVAAVAGPLLFLVGTLGSSMVTLGGAFVATGTAAAGATPRILLLRGALTGLLKVGGAIALALAAVAAAAWVVSRDTLSAAESTKKLADRADEAEAEADRLEGKLAQAAGAADEFGGRMDDAEGKVRKLQNAMADSIGTALRFIKVLAQADIFKLSSRNLEIDLEKQSLENAARGPEINQTRSGLAMNQAGRGARVRFNTDARLAELQRERDANDRQMLARLKALRDGVDLDATEGDPGETGATGGPTKPGPKPKTPKSDARDPADIAADFADEQVRLEMEALQAKQRLATGSEERAELQYDMLEIERAQRLAEVETSDFSAQQKDALRAQVEELYGVAAAVDEQGVIVANANRGLIARQIEQDRTYELEQRLADAMQVQFELRRDHLQLDLQMADTQAERRRLALEILALEQAYRRNQLEMVLASEISTQAEKDRAQAILASLGALERKETAAADKANRTEVESYRDYVNMSAGQINEAIDGIKIDGLEALNQGLVDAMTGVKSLGEVFKNVASQIISDLLRIAIRKAVIAPLADALFGGGGSSPLNLLSGTPFDLDGARAMGGPVLAGGTYLVGERGPELFRPHSSGSIVPNHKLSQMGGGPGGGGELSIRLGAGLEAEWLRKSAGQAVQIVQAVAPGMLSTASSKARRDAARPVMPGGATG
ncbi:phage tail tape measure protein [Qipengyuania sp. SM2507]